MPGGTGYPPWLRPHRGAHLFIPVLPKNNSAEDNDDGTLAPLAPRITQFSRDRSDHIWVPNYLLDRAELMCYDPVKLEDKKEPKVTTGSQLNLLRVD